MARFLFLTWNGSGNQVPALGAAQALRSHGHEVIFAGYESQCARISEHGFRFLVMERANAHLQMPPQGGEGIEGIEDAKGDIHATLVTGVWASGDAFDDLRDLMAREQPDLLVIDCFLLGMLVAAERLRTPAVVLVHGTPGAQVPPGGPFEHFYLLDALNGLRTTAGLPSVASVWEQWARFPTMCASLPELDPLAATVPPSFTYVGPLQEHLPPSGWRAPWSVEDARPLILVSFSAAGVWDQTSRLQRTLDGLAEQPLRILVTGEAAESGALTVPANAIVVPFVPHTEVLPQTAAVVTHGGHGTLTTALAYGVPLVLLPNATSDQPALAAQVAAMGAGIVLDGDEATAAEIGAAVRQVLSEPHYTIAARRFAARIAEARPEEAAVRWLEQQVSSSSLR